VLLGIGDASIVQELVNKRPPSLTIVCHHHYLPLLKEADGAEDAKCREKVQQSGGRQQGREML
jgi:hypothetical protein